MLSLEFLGEGTPRFHTIHENFRRYFESFPTHGHMRRKSQGEKGKQKFSLMVMLNRSRACNISSC